jgi:hypothetical protein
MSTQVEHLSGATLWVGSLPYLLMLDKAGKACQGQTL